MVCSIIFETRPCFISAVNFNMPHKVSKYATYASNNVSTNTDWLCMCTCLKDPYLETFEYRLVLDLDLVDFVIYRSLDFSVVIGDNNAIHLTKEQ